MCKWRWNTPELEQAVSESTSKYYSTDTDITCKQIQGTLYSKGQYVNMHVNNSELNGSGFQTLSHVPPTSLQQHQPSCSKSVHLNSLESVLFNTNDYIKVNITICVLYKWTFVVGYHFCFHHLSITFIYSTSFPLLLANYKNWLSFTFTYCFELY